MSQEEIFSPQTSRQINRFRSAAFVAGLIGTVVAMAGLLIAGPAYFFQAYLFSYLFWLEVSLGSFAVALLHYLVGGEWGMMIRRIAEAASKTLWLLALLFIPIVLGLQYLYPWARPEEVALDSLLQHKWAYLNPVFFTIRAVIYFAIWLGLSWRIIRWGKDPATFTDPTARRNFQRVSAIGLIIYVLTMSFASIDWMMSLQPHWFSSIYGLMIIVGQSLTGFAFSIAALPWLVGHSAVAKYINPRHYRDLGALLLTFVVVWAYIAYSQLLIIYAANLPAEVTWYLARVQGGWLWIGLLILAVQFFLPFVVLLSLRAKRDPRVIGTLSFVILLMRLFGNYWEVIPAFRPSQLAVHWLDLVLPIAIGGLWFAAFAWHLLSTPLLLPLEPKPDHLLPGHDRPVTGY